MYLSSSLQAAPRLTLPEWSELTLALPPALAVKAKVKVTDSEAVRTQLAERPGSLLPETPGVLYHLSVETRLKWFLSTKTWEGELWLQPNMIALQRTRLKSGKNRNFKIYRYANNGVYRIRHHSPDNTGPPQSWPVEDERFYPFPPTVSTQCQLISDPYALLLLLSQDTIDGKEGLCVFNKNNVYRVLLRPDGHQTLSIDYEFGNESVRKIIQAERILILPEPFEVTTGFPVEAFEFLGMEGSITALRDPAHHLPLQLEGNVPGFGYAKLRLIRVKPQ